MFNIRALIMLSIAIIVALVSCRTARNTDSIKVDLTPTSQSSKTAVKGENFRGTIFNQDYPFAYLFLGDSSSIQRFSPTAEEIEQVEITLHRQIKALNYRRLSQTGHCPIIEKNINNYFRQYAGFVNSKGQKVVHINFYWDKYTIANRLKGYSDGRLSFESDYAIVFDGCSYYWQVNVNLTTDKLYGFSVNGPG